MSPHLTPDELWKLKLDEDALETLAMTPDEIRADLVAMGCDPDAIEREGRAFLGLPPKRTWKPVAWLVARLGILAALGETLVPAIPDLAPLTTAAAAAPSQEGPPTTAAAAPPADRDTDGGSR